MSVWDAAMENEKCVTSFFPVLWYKQFDGVKQHFIHCKIRHLIFGGNIKDNGLGLVSKCHYGDYQRRPPVSDKDMMGRRENYKTYQSKNGMLSHSSVCPSWGPK